MHEKGLADVRSRDCKTYSDYANGKTYSDYANASKEGLNGPKKARFEGKGGMAVSHVFHQGERKGICSFQGRKTAIPKVSNGQKRANPKNGMYRHCK